MTLLETQSLASPEVLENPDAYHHALHERPVFFDPRLGFFICSTYRLMREILRNTDVFSSIDSQSMDSMRPPPAEVTRLRATMHPVVNTLVTNDPPSHTRVRAMVDEPFRPRSIEKLTDRIRSIVNESIDEFIDAGAFDAVTQLAIPIPIKVIADLLGVDRRMAPQIKMWSDASVEPLGMMISDERLIECTRLVKEFQDFMASQLEARRAHPRDDLLTDLVTARDRDGAPFSMAEMLSLTSQFLVAGNETTTNAIAAGVQLLVDNPDQQEILRREPSRMRVFINEVLRLEAPVQGLFRVVTADTELDGVSIPRGSRIMLRFAAANRDPGKFPHPDLLDVTRHNAGANVSFGAGIHHCIGANLAREELVQTFDLLLRRTTNLAYPEGRNDFKHHPSMILRGLKQLHVTFEKIA